MTSGDEPSADLLRGAADLLRALLDELPAAGSRDTALRSKVAQRAAALDDVREFEPLPPVDSV